MLTGIQGLTGYGKTLFMSLLLREKWRQNAPIYPNFDLWFDENRKGTGIQRWWTLDDTFELENGVIAIDEGAKVLDARKFMSLPKPFADKIAEHRHYDLNMIYAVQDFNDIDVRIRRNTHEIFTCNSILRIPRNETVKPVLQIVRVNKKVRVPSDSMYRMKWRDLGNFKTMFISKYWTKTYYNTYSRKIGESEFLIKVKCETKAKKSKWTGKMYQANLVHSGKARL